MKLSKDDRKFVKDLILSAPNYYQAIVDVIELYGEYFTLEKVCRLIDKYNTLNPNNYLSYFYLCEKEFRDNSTFLSARLSRYPKYKAVFLCRSITGLTFREAYYIVDKIMRDNPTSILATWTADKRHTQEPLFHHSV